MGKIIGLVFDSGEKKEKALGKMNTAELEAKAAELGVDITECASNKERAAKIAEVIGSDE